MSGVRIEYMRVGGDLYVCDKVGGVSVLVLASVVLNDKAYRFLADNARKDDGWGVVGVCEIVGRK